MGLSQGETNHQGKNEILLIGSLNIKNMHLSSAQPSLSTCGDVFLYTLELHASLLPTELSIKRMQAYPM